MNNASIDELVQKTDSLILDLRSFATASENIDAQLKQFEENTKVLNLAKAKLGQDLLALKSKEDSLRAEQVTLVSNNEALSIRKAGILKEEDRISREHKDLVELKAELEKRQQELDSKALELGKLDKLKAFLEEERSLVEREKSIDRERKENLRAKEKSLEERERQLQSQVI